MQNAEGDCDRATSWALTLTTGLISTSFASSTQHYFFAVLVFLVCIFWFYESRRYRFFNMYRVRVRILETYFFAASVIVLPDDDYDDEDDDDTDNPDIKDAPEQQRVWFQETPILRADNRQEKQRIWMKKLRASLRSGIPEMTQRDAMYLRLRGAYMPLFTIVYACWLMKLNGQDILSWQMSLIGGLPWLSILLWTLLSRAPQPLLMMMRRS